MSLDELKQNVGELTFKPHQAQIEGDELIVQEVEISPGESSHIIDLGGDYSWDDAVMRAMELMTAEHMSDIQKEDILASASGGDPLSVNGDTKIFRTLLVIGYLQPVPTDVVGDVLEQDNPGSMIGNATHRDLVQPVAKNGNNRYYSLTPQGWKQVVAVHGVKNWRSEAEKLLSGYTPAEDEDQEQQTGLAAFGYDKE